MSYVSKHFGVKDLLPKKLRKNNVSDYIKDDLLIVLDEIWDIIGPFSVNIANLNYRCYRDSGSKKYRKDSYHSRGMAADISVSGVPSKTTYDKIILATQQGKLAKLGRMENILDTTGKYGGWVHVDLGPRNSNGEVRIFREGGKGETSIKGSKIYPDSMMAVKSTDTSEVDAADVEEIEEEESENTSNGSYSLAIGNEIILSNYISSSESIEYFKNILTKSKIEENVINSIIKGLGLSNSNAVEFANNSDISLTNIQCDNLFTEFLFENKLRFERVFGCALKDHPIEVNTALISYIYDINLNDPVIVRNEIEPMIVLLKNKKYNDLASFIETHGSTSNSEYLGLAVNVIGNVNRLSVRRTKEANLIRARASDKPNYNTQTNSSTAIGDPDVYFSQKDPHGDALSAENSKKQALSEYRAFSNNNYSKTDETYAEITKEVADNYAEMYQIHQITTDGISVEGEGDYEYRLRIKKFYNIETRAKNLSYFQIEKQVQDEGGDIDQLSASYDYIPYGHNMFQDIKKNAVARCIYRIKKLKKEIGEITEEVTSYGLFDMDLSTEELITLSLINPVIGLAMVVLQNLFGSYTTKRVILNEEEKNLKYLIQEQARFTKTNSSN